MAKKEYEHGQNIFSSTRINAILLIALGVAIALGISLIIIKSINQSISQASLIVKKLAQGDLTIDISIENKDEIGRLLENLKVMVAKLKEVISAVSAASSNIASASLLAVVAAEVRKLADRSQMAAVEIDSLSFSGVVIAEKSGSLLQQVVPNIEKTFRLVQEISASSLE